MSLPQGEVSGIECGESGGVRVVCPINDAVVSIKEFLDQGRCMHAYRTILWPDFIQDGRYRHGFVCELAKGTRYWYGYSVDVGLVKSKVHQNAANVILYSTSTLGAVLWCMVSPPRGLLSFEEVPEWFRLKVMSAYVQGPEVELY